MRATILCVVLLIGCTPDYSNTTFRCDQSHGCPTAQTCIAGRCHRGTVMGDGVVCGLQICDQTQQCCFDTFNPARCVAAGDPCAGTSAICDGIEDCAIGDRCCSTETTACGATCDTYACRQTDDCPAALPNCCFGDNARPWGECSDLPC